MLRNILVISTLSGALFSAFAAAQIINNFTQSKAVAAQIHQDTSGFFYCGCRISWDGKKAPPISPPAVIYLKYLITVTPYVLKIENLYRILFPSFYVLLGTIYALSGLNQANIQVNIPTDALHQ